MSVVVHSFNCFRCSVSRKRAFVSLSKSPSFYLIVKLRFGPSATMFREREKERVRERERRELRSHIGTIIRVDAFEVHSLDIFLWNERQRPCSMKLCRSSLTQASFISRSVRSCSFTQATSPFREQSCLTGGIVDKAISDKSCLARGIISAQETGPGEWFGASEVFNKNKSWKRKSRASENVT